MATQAMQPVARAPISQVLHRMLRLLASSSPESIFLVIGIIFGVLMTFATLPLAVADEQAHLFRAYQVSEFRILAEREGGQVGAHLPASLGALYAVMLPLQEAVSPAQRGTAWWQAAAMPLQPTVRAFLVFPGAAFYTPISYLPQALGILPGRLMHWPPLTLMYLARLTNLCCWALIIFAAIRLIPIGKWVLTALALLPLSIFQAASVSADALLFALCFFYIAFLLHLRIVDPERPCTPGQLLGVLLLSLCVALVKCIAFLPLILLVLLIPRKKIGSWRRYTVCLSILLACVVCASGLWLRANRAICMDHVFRPGVSPSQQLAGVIAEPWTFAKVVARTYLSKTRSFVYELTTGPVGGRITIPGAALIGLIWCLVALADRSGHAPLTRGQNAIMMLSVIAILLITSLSMYLYWTPVGERYIEGLQGRYAYPVLPLLFLPFVNRGPWDKQTTDYLPAVLIACTTTYLVFTVLTVSRIIPR